MKYLKKFKDLNENWFSDMFIDTSDSDLGKQILDYLENYVSDITRAGDSNRFYFFSDKIFFKKTKVSTGEYRIDIAMVSEEKSGLHKDPYQIFISKVEKDELSIARGGDVGVLKDYKPTGWRSRSKKPAGNIKTSKSEGMQKLDLNNNLAKKIYDKAEDIWSKTNRNVKSTARGGKSRSSGWKWKI
jgi:hypothetical protein